MKRFFNGSVHRPLLKDTLFKNKNFILLFTLTMFLSFPVPLMLNKNYIFDYIGNDFYTSTMALFYVATAAILIIVPFFFFNYLTKKRSVDFIHSLPISRIDLFLTYSLASFLIVFIPFLLTYWFGMGVVYVNSSLSFQWQHLFLFIQAVLLFAAIQLPTIFVIMNTGTLSDSVIFTLILFAAPFIAYVAISDFTSSYLIGIANLSSTNILLYISPAAYFVSTLSNDLIAIDNNILTLYWIIFALIGYIVSGSMYRHWKSEFSEKPFNNEYFYPFVASLFTALLFIFMLAAFSEDPNAPLRFLSPRNLIYPVLFTYIFYLVLDFIKQRSTKFFFVATKHYVYIIIFALSVSTIVFTTQGFGYAWSVPKEDKVESIKFKVGSYYYDPFDRNNYEVVITDEDEIHQVLSGHQALVNDFKAANKFFSETKLDQYSNIGMITFEYTLTGNDKLKRTFKIPQQLADSLYDFTLIPSIQKSANKVFLEEKVSEVRVFDGGAINEYVLMDENINTLKRLIELDYDSMVGKTYDDQDYQIQSIVTFARLVNDQSDEMERTTKDTIYLDLRFENALSYLKNFAIEPTNFVFQEEHSSYVLDFDLNHIQTVLDSYYQLDPTQVISKEEQESQLDSFYSYQSKKTIESIIQVLTDNDEEKVAYIILAKFK